VGSVRTEVDGLRFCTSYSGGRSKPAPLREKNNCDGQWQPQVRGVQPQEPLVDALELLDELLAPLPLCAAKTENWIACFLLPHFGHSGLELLDITIRSWWVWQSSQTYS
jgi:hypothetical protein